MVHKTKKYEVLIYYLGDPYKLIIATNNLEEVKEQVVEALKNLPSKAEEEVVVRKN